MSFIHELYAYVKIHFDDRFGPDLLLTHWMLYFKPTSRFLAQKTIRRLGKNVHIRPFVTITGGKKITLGDNVLLRPFTSLMAGSPDGKGEIIIENDVLIGPNVFIAVSRHAYDNIQLPVHDQGYKESLSVYVRSGAWLGAYSIILPGITIGKNSVVAAGSVVTKSVDDYCVVGGNPARVINNLS